MDKGLDRQALAQRNRRVARALHRTTFKQRIRRAALVDLGRLPIPNARRADPNRILLIRPDALGDVLLTTPAIRALRAALPHAQIHALAGPWSADVLSAYDEIDMVLTLPFPGFSRARPGQPPAYRLLLDAAQTLRDIGYGSAVIFRPDHWWGGLLAKFAGIPERIGYRLPDVKPFLTHGQEYLYTHSVTASLRLVERWTGPIAPADADYRFPVDSIDRDELDELLETADIGPRQPLVVIHPGAGTTVKRWTEEQWSSVGDALAGQLDATVVLTGTEREQPLIQEIAVRLSVPFYPLAGDTSVRQLAALYQRAKIVLGPDSGPLHLAAAVGTPTVTLFGPADPVEFGPWGPRDRHLVLTSTIGCRPCRILNWDHDDLMNHPCVRDITVAQVLYAARRVMQPALR